MKYRLINSIQIVELLEIKACQLNTDDRFTGSTGWSTQYRLQVYLKYRLVIPIQIIRLLEVQAGNTIQVIGLHKVQAGRLNTDYRVT